MSKKMHVANVDGSYNFPRGFTISDNRIEDMLQRYLTPSEYTVWRQYLRYWGSDKKKAYPSLALLSEVTGLSEKTIRKCNKELSKKRFLTYISGGPGRSNRYCYRPIENIITEYCKEIPEEEETDEEPIVEVGSSSDNTTTLLSKLDNVSMAAVKKFISEFNKCYKEKYGYEYRLEEKDSTVLVANKKGMNNYINLIGTFFKTKNKYIEDSDRSIFFFFRPTVLKAMIAEYGETNDGRWQAQAEKIWESIKKSLPESKDDILYPDEWIKEHATFSGANQERDEYVLSILVKKIADYYL